MSNLPKIVSVFTVLAGFLLAMFVSANQQPQASAGNKLQDPVKKVAPESKAQQPKVKQKDMPLERARREVKLLDDIYKTAIVLITEHYVNSDDDLPAGEAFKLLFARMSDKGWHEVKLLDATGEPLNDENEPAAGFEKTAVKQLVDGKPYYDEVITEKGKRYLRAATAIPVVMDKCVMCHDNYANLPKGKAIGAVGFKVPILDDEDGKKVESKKYK